jgi:hypothetical protein
MKCIAISRLLGLVALLTLATGIAAHPAHATSIGLLPVGGSYSDTISSSGPTFSRDYDFQLAGASDLTILATAFGETSPAQGVDLLKISLYDSASNLIATASGTPIAFFDSFQDSGILLGAGAYLFTVFGKVTPGKLAFVSVSLAANHVTPIPAAGLMMLTGLGALGGLVWRRRSADRRGGAVPA